jgi:ATP-dependent Clp protease, protease subunit
MPLPEPHKEESKDDFIDRCMGDENAVKEFPEESQRRAVCETQWNEDKKEDKTKNETFDCECIECGHKMTSEQHCKDIKCPECGGTMRRAERPGAGEENKIAGLKVVKNIAEKSADIWIYQDIGTGWFDGFSAKQFADEVKKIGKVDVLNVYLNSPGGDVFDGVAIYNILQRHRAKVVVEIDALAASIASLIAMAGDEIRMAENALLMIHNPWGFVIGDVNDLRKAIEDLDKIKDSAILPAYVSQSGMDEKEISKLMDEETWLSAAEAKEYGFVDTIVENKQIAAHIDREKYKQVFNKIPEGIEIKKEMQEDVKEEISEIEEKPTKPPKKKTNMKYWQDRLSRDGKRKIAWNK